MNFNITGRNVNVTDGLRRMVDKKLGKLDKFFKPETICNVTFSEQKNLQKVEVTIPIRDGVIRAEEASGDMYQSIDLVMDVLERQIRRYRTRLIDRKQSVQAFSDTFIEEDEETDDSEIRIVRTKHFDLKPMTPEEACLEMELVGHDFFVFQNGDTGNVAVVYKRKGNSYGLIEPEFT